MNITIIISMIILAASLQGLFLAFILAKKASFRKKSNLYLAIFILAFSLSNLHYVALIFGAIQSQTWFFYLSFPWTFLIPIVFYFFIVYLLNPSYNLTRRDYWLFCPFIIQLGFHIVLFFLDLFDASILDSHKDLISFIDIKVETIISIVLNLIFIPLVYKKLTDYETMLKNNYSEISRSSVEWLKKLLNYLIIIWIIWALPAIYQMVTEITTPSLDLILWCLMSACIYWMGYTTYFRSDIFFAEVSFPSILKPQTRKATVKTENNKSARELENKAGEDSLVEQSLKKEGKPIDLIQVSKVEAHFTRMIKIIETQKLYADPEFNLIILSERCELSANYLSQIISKKSGNNFYSLINEYRVDEVKRMLRKSEFSHYSLLGIGLEAGFKSKSSFYKIFKEQTGQTPSQYQKKHLNIL